MDAVLALIFATYTSTFGLPEGLLSSVCFVETRHIASAYSANDGGTPSIGVCQVKMTSARHMGFKGIETQLQEPTTNVYYAAKYLRYQIDRYGSVERGVVAFNRGNAKGLRSTKYSAKVMKQWKGTQYAEIPRPDRNY